MKNKTMETSTINEGMSFEEMLDASFKTLRTGERVKGTVTSVTPTEVHVDLGIKYTGMIPLSELTDDPTAKPEDIVKPGDEIDVVVVKPNDAEGTILLSKKRIDADKNWGTHSLRQNRTERFLPEKLLRLQRADWYLSAQQEEFLYRYLRQRSPDVSSRMKKRICSSLQVRCSSLR